MRPVPLLLSQANTSCCTLSTSITPNITDSVYCGGNIAGPHLFLPSETPRYFSAIKGLLVAYCIAAGLQAVYSTLCYLENKRRDREGFRADEEVEALEGFGDLSDKENVHFRYRI